jgi:hypothetical protein
MIQLQLGQARRDKICEVSMAKQITSANGKNKKRATPSRKNIGTKLFQFVTCVALVSRVRYVNY